MKESRKEIKCSFWKSFALGISSYFLSYTRFQNFEVVNQKHNSINQDDILASLADFAIAYNKVVQKK
ncbi:MAG: hypothetical protein RLZZ59_731 [Pseudomonadota bacterium]|jgi:hypothetical protein